MPIDLAANTRDSVQIHRLCDMLMTTLHSLNQLVLDSKSLGKRLVLVELVTVYPENEKNWVYVV